MDFVNSNSLLDVLFIYFFHILSLIWSSVLMHKQNHQDENFRPSCSLEEQWLIANAKWQVSVQFCAENFTNHRVPTSWWRDIFKLHYIYRLICIVYMYYICNVLLAWHCKITIMYVFNTDTLWKYVILDVLFGQFSTFLKDSTTFVCGLGGF